MKKPLVKEKRLQMLGNQPLPIHPQKDIEWIRDPTVFLLRRVSFKYWRLQSTVMTMLSFLKLQLYNVM